MSVHTEQRLGSQAGIVLHPAQLTGGWLIDEQGREIAITEQMIQDACEALERGNLSLQPLSRQAC
ncbi:MAG: hypothetical protein CVV16_02615 [Gammaproteobacteria bacterium HGW-Gammaproteobacteria-6]|nr:MAG: hypothetical protein CVV16_02615 [Gammaproteobacteria bacterium HGW-Gammaproteobacteria-6]